MLDSLDQSTLDTLSVMETDEALAVVEQRLALRNQISYFEQQLASQPAATYGDSPDCPLTHSFANGIYMREIFIPAGKVLTGKIHRHAHPNILLEGEVLVVTEHAGKQHLKAPLAMISEPGTKRVVFALSDTRWLTFHNVGEERDLSKIEDIVIVSDYKQLASEQRKELAL